MLKRVLIILSKQEKFLESALKIKMICKMECLILYIEDNIIDMVENNDIIYFLTNSSLIVSFVEKIDKNNNYIINKDFYLKCLSKIEIQKLLEDNGINVPKMFSVEEINNYNYPIFIKENNHAGGVFLVYTKQGIENFFKKFPKKNYYIEERIDGIKEYKLYYSFSEVNYKDDIIENNYSISNIVKRVTEILNVEVLSLDLIVSNDKYYVIDVNLSPGYYYCDKGRKKLVEYFESL